MDDFSLHEHKTAQYIVDARLNWVFPFLPPLGKQLLPLSSSLHGGASQLWQGPAGGLAGPLGTGEGNNLVWMRNQTLGQSAPSLTGLVSPGTYCVLF